MKNSISLEAKTGEEQMMSKGIKSIPYSFNTSHTYDNEKNSKNIIRTRRRKSNSEKGNRVCVVCGEKASGFNFDRLTCESCKAFFRRNAMKSNKKMKPCPHDGGCNISGSQRKHCPYCRLEKCFSEGMKRELILPPEKLEQRAKPKRRKTLMMDDMNVYRTSAYPISSRSHGSTDSQDLCLQKSLINNSPIVSESAEVSSMNNDSILKRENSTSTPYLNKETKPLISTFEMNFSLDDQGLLMSLSECIAKLKEPFTVQDYPDTETAQTLEEAYNRMDSCIRRIIRLVKLLPCFSELDKQMQLMLLRTNIYGLIIIYSSFFFEKKIRKLCYPVVNEDGNVHLITVSVSPDDLGLSDFQSNDGGLNKEDVILNGSLKQAVQEDFELYKENTIAAFTELQELTSDDNVLKVLILAIKLFDHDNLPYSMRLNVKITRNKFFCFLMRYLRVKQKSPSVGILHFSRVLMGFIDICTLEIRMNEFAKLLSLDGLSPLMREVCSQRPLVCS